MPCGGRNEELHCEGNKWIVRWVGRDEVNMMERGNKELAMRGRLYKI